MRWLESVRVGRIRRAAIRRTRLPDGAALIRPTFYSYHTQKKPVQTDGLLHCLMHGGCRASPPTHPTGRCCATFKSAFRRISPPSGGAHRQTTDKTKGPVFRLSLSFY
ncbi:hypothetical protein KCP71_05515 [Salmonella enterica subsp. enterica]|nr:hypothetical protein KCP71_05515 [Salmonella enterica subsp. enterica]